MNLHHNVYVDNLIQLFLKIGLYKCPIFYYIWLKEDKK
jgi:hypothetical protein